MIDQEYFKAIALAVYLVILGLAITNVVGHFARLLKSSKTSALYWVHILWSIMLFSLLLQLAEHAWGFRESDNWSHPYLLGFLLNPLVVYFATEIIFPGETGASSSKEHYYKVHRQFFGALTFLSIANYIIDSVMIGYINIGFILAYTIVFSIFTLSLCIIKSEAFHKYTTIIIVPIFISFIYILSSNYADPNTYERSKSVEKSKPANQTAHTTPAIKPQ